MVQPCLYELFCLAKPQLSKAHLGQIIKAASLAVLNQGGVVTDIKSFGEQPLAYDIRKPGSKHSEVSTAGVAIEVLGVVVEGRLPIIMTAPSCCHGTPAIVLQGRNPPALPAAPQAAMWQLTFAGNPKVLADIDHTLRVDERVLRWIVMKRRAFENLPNPYKVARAAEKVAVPLGETQQQQQH